jgi:uncharacterized repeat protein (TIGR03803 family)
MFCATTVMVSTAQTFSTEVSFDGSNGARPLSLAQGTDGNFYGTSSAGGTSNSCNGGCGVVFKITAGGKLTLLHSFGSTDGAGPNAPLVQGVDGSFYGTTSAGGTSNSCSGGCGTVFKIRPDGSLSTLHNFDMTDGANPLAGLVQGTDGNFYGTTGNGGTFFSGAVFKISPGGSLTTLHSFGFNDGTSPNAVVQGADGAFYGTAFGGGTGPNCGQQGCGTVFKILSDGSFLTLHSFNYTDGYGPDAALVRARDGKFYGTTSTGGANSNGTVFQMTSGGVLTTLYSFCSQANCTDGISPSALLQATDGNFYGATGSGGANGEGTVFKITSGGLLTTLYSFCTQTNCTDGIDPSGLLQTTSGNFLGTTWFGGANGDGTIFSLSVGLGPFVETQPTSGKIGASVTILGTNLTAATSVTFNGKSAKFTVVSRSEISAVVPTGATTGRVKVETPNGLLVSNVAFRVVQ